MNALFDKLYKERKEDFFQLVKKDIEKNKRNFIVTANPETFNIGENNPDFYKLLIDSKTTLIPDGIGIVKAARILKYKVKERITGIDLASYLLNLANEKELKVALLGAKKEIIDMLQEKIKTEYPNIKLVKCMDGYNDKKDEFFTNIAKDSPDIVLVALGIPKQEELIYKHIDKFKKGIFVGVGGSFDVLSGNKKRAPKIFQKLNLEWLYRIAKEPSRLKRFWNNNIKFLIKIELKKFRKDK